MADRSASAFTEASEPGPFADLTSASASAVAGIPSVRPPCASRSRLTGKCSAQDLAVRHRHRPLEPVLQLADIPGPGICAENVEEFGGKPPFPLPGVGGEPGEELLGDRTQVLRTLAQRRNPDRDDVDAVIQVGGNVPCPTISSRFRAVAAIRRRSTRRERPPPRGRPPFPAGPAEVSPASGGAFADFVEKEGPAGRELELPGSPPCAPR